MSTFSNISANHSLFPRADIRDANAPCEKIIFIKFDLLSKCNQLSYQLKCAYYIAVTTDCIFNCGGVMKMTALRWVDGVEQTLSMLEVQIMWSNNMECLSL
jgi:hypothetical protein